MEPCLLTTPSLVEEVVVVAAEVLPKTTQEEHEMVPMVETEL